MLLAESRSRLGSGATVPPFLPGQHLDSNLASCQFDSTSERVLRVHGDFKVSRQYPSDRQQGEEPVGDSSRTRAPGSGEEDRSPARTSFHAVHLSSPSRM